MSAIETPLQPSEALALQLDAFAGDSPREWFLEIRSTRKPGGMAQEFVPLAQLERAQEIISTRAAEQNTYVGVAPRTRQSGKAEAIEHSHVLWVDIDTHEAAVQLVQFSPQPHLVIQSGSDGSVHAYWRLAKPLAACFVRRANLRLAQRLGADTNACDPARIMRPVGSLNHKHRPPRPVQLVGHLGASDAYSVRDVIGGLMDHRRYLPKPEVPPRWSSRPANPSRVIEGVCRAVRDASAGERNAVLNWGAWRLGQKLACGELDADVTTPLLHAAIDAGLPTPEAMRTIASGLSAATGRAAR